MILRDLRLLVTVPLKPGWQSIALASRVGCLIPPSDGPTRCDEHSSSRGSTCRFVHYVAYAWYCEIPSSNVVPQCTHFDLVVPIGRTSSSTHCHYSLKTRRSEYNLGVPATSFSLWPSLVSYLKAVIALLGTVIPCHASGTFLTTGLRQ